MRIPELRWCRAASGRPARRGATAKRPATVEIVSLREVVASCESYEPALLAHTQPRCARTRARRVSSTVLRLELARVLESPIVLNRRLREVVLAAVEREELSMSEIAMRCGRVKRDRNGNESGETSWLARRLGLLAEGGQRRPTPWIHSDVLALIARRGLGIARARWSCELDAAPTILLVEAEHELARSARRAAHRRRLSRWSSLAPPSMPACSRAPARPRSPCSAAVDAPRGAVGLLEEIRAARPGRAVGPVAAGDRASGARARELDLLRAFEAGADDFLGRGARYLELQGAAARDPAACRGRCSSSARARRGRSCASTCARALGDRRTDAGSSCAGSSSTCCVHLAREPARVFTRRELMASVWGAARRRRARARSTATRAGCACSSHGMRIAAG